MLTSVIIQAQSNIFQVESEIIHKQFLFDYKPNQNHYMGDNIYAYLYIILHRAISPKSRNRSYILVKIGSGHRDINII